MASHRRNIRGLGLSPGVTRAQRREVERIVTAALNKMTGDLQGKYYPLGNMSEVRIDLIRSSSITKH